MGKVPENLIPTVTLIGQTLASTKYAIRGTASLVLQELDFNVSDIDIVCNEDTALLCNKLLAEYLVKPVTYSESDKFKSFFGEFNINDISVEVMGNLQIKDSQGVWSKVFDGTDRLEKIIGNTKVYLTTLESELAMFMYMQRWNVYHKIKKEVELKSSPQLGLF